MLTGKCSGGPLASLEFGAKAAPRYAVKPGIWVIWYKNHISIHKGVWYWEKKLLCSPGQVDGEREVELGEDQTKG